MVLLNAFEQSAILMVSSMKFLLYLYLIIFSWTKLYMYLWSHKYNYDDVFSKAKLSAFTNKWSSTSHSDVQYIESLWTIRHYVMRATINN